MHNLSKIGLGGGCHWCTEAVFQSLKGVHKVGQGWISSIDENDWLSEAVIVHFDPTIIDLQSIIEIHLHTHSSTSDHPLRKRYRSAVYTFDQRQMDKANSIIEQSKADFDKTILTKVMSFSSFKLNQEKYLDYYKKNSENQFCTNYIAPKFKILIDKFSTHIKEQNTSPH